MGPPGGTVLFVEDDAILSEIYAAKLRAEGFTVHTAPDVATARRLSDEERLDMVCLDARLPDGSGAELGTELATRGLRVFLLTNDQELVDHPPAGIEAALLKIMTPPADLVAALRRQP